MSELVNETVDMQQAPHPICAAAQLAQLVDQQINGGAQREFDDATSELQESDADQGHGSAYLDGSVVEFEPKEVNCGMCRGTAMLYRDGSVEAEACKVTGNCELEWAKKYPAEYRDLQTDQKTGSLVCSAEVTCSALIGMCPGANNKLTAILQAGICELAMRGDAWQARRDESLGYEKVVNPDTGIPEFDGAGSGREE